MSVKKRITHYRRNPMNIIQYILGIMIVLIFFLSLIPGIYSNLFHVQVILVLIQLIISISRVRILNIFFEIVMLILGIIIAIPSLFKNIFLVGLVLLIINYIFIAFAILVSLIDMSTFKSSMIYKRVEIFTKNAGTRKKSRGKPSSSKKVGHKKERTNVKDASFEEKKKPKKSKD